MRSGCHPCRMASRYSQRDDHESPSTPVQCRLFTRIEHPTRLVAAEQGDNAKTATLGTGVYKGSSNEELLVDEAPKQRDER
ncbi:hypothetical protein AMTR_s00031p00090350 [Amborella trichopoda]|uniref:Uncharacterized protein n=1 Tax=Amborella trichopoda TaxID=13333 RepID=U5D291_AMBTC|nr:hypothetical protein AMTR_s00031p00090350 [Amborella trichopoda]